MSEPILSIKKSTHRRAAASPRLSAAERHEMLHALQQKVLWLSTWMVHHANHMRPNLDGLKVGGHQASSSSVVTLLSALYFDVLRPEDRVAVKPHASPVYHAIQYLLGRQTKSNLERFRAFGGAQSYPSRTKDADDVDISTGSVGLGVAHTIFSSLVQDFLEARDWLSEDRPLGRMIALVGDAELDEGSVFEALFEGWKHSLRNVWWIIDYNRQSLDLVVEDQLAQRVHQMFRLVDWNVIVLKYGRLLQTAFAKPGGNALQHWIDNCPNSLYSALVFQGGAAWRAQLQRDLGTTPGVLGLLEDYDDRELQALMTNLGGHDLESVLEAMHSIQDDQPTAIVAYTIKGHGLPMAGHKDNHAGLMSPQQIDEFRESLGIAAGHEWDAFAGLGIPAEKVERFIADVPFAQSFPRRFEAPRVELQGEISVPVGDSISTQAAFGRLMNELARRNDVLAERFVTISPDVASSTNLGPWITKRGIFRRHSKPNVFAEQKISSSLPWSIGPTGQHIELGIAETNLFMLLSACGLSAEHHGIRLLPIGTLYDPFVCRGLDALNYGCYQDSRFIVVGTPSGVSLSPEGGAHQSIYTPLIGIGQPGLTYFEPAFADELRVMLEWSIGHLQDDDGGSVYLRLSTRKVDQPARTMDAALREAILRGGYWLSPPAAAASHAIVTMGAMVPEAIAAQGQLAERGPAPGVLVVTSPDVLYNQASSHRSELLSRLAPNTTLVTVLDGHPLTLGWLGGNTGMRVIPLGVSKFGMSGYPSEVYREHKIDARAIVDAVLRDAASAPH